MKKIVSTLLAVVMLTMCLGTTGFAADREVSFDQDTLYDLIDVLDRNMPNTWGERVDVFNVFKVYAQTSESLETLIGLLDDVVNNDSRVPEGAIGKEALDGIIANVGSVLVSNKDAIKFALSVIRALPDGQRADAIEAFTDAQADGTGVTLTSDEQAALDAVYGEFVHNDGDEPGKDWLENSHGITPNTILHLAKGFQDSLKLTDVAKGSDNFAVKSVSDSFKENLGTFVGQYFDTINGNEVTGQAVLDAMIAALNGFGAELKQDIKTVLGASEIALYEPLKDDSGTSTGNTPGVGGSGLGGNKPSASKPADKIGEIQPVTTPVGEPAPAEAAYIYNDTEEHWAKDYIADLSKRGIFNGYEDGSFKPDMGITREEIAVAMTRALGLESKARYAPRYNFSDSSFISLWAADAVNMMVKEGVFTGYDDNEYKPKRVITREELVAVVMRIFDDNLLKAQLTYADHHEIGDWSRAYVKKATELTIVGGYPDGTFRPANPITRAEAAKILYTFMHYAGLL